MVLESTGRGQIWILIYDTTSFTFVGNDRIGKILYSRAENNFSCRFAAKVIKYRVQISGF
jgi:hypothetical protein